MIDIKIATPVVNLTGNSKESLRGEWFLFKDQLYHARENIRVEMETIVSAFPHESFHGRNHFVKGQGADHEACLHKMEIFKELNALRTKVDRVLGEYHQKSEQIIESIS